VRHVYWIEKKYMRLFWKTFFEDFGRSIPESIVYLKKNLKITFLRGENVFILEISPLEYKKENFLLIQNMKNYLSDKMLA
jgi:hypothetical protein